MGDNGLLGGLAKKYPDVTCLILMVLCAGWAVCPHTLTDHHVYRTLLSPPPSRPRWQTLA